MPRTAPTARRLAVVGCTMLGAYVAFQLALVAGAPLGRFAWGGRHTALPIGFRLASVATAALYGTAGWLLLRSTTLIGNSVPRGARRWLTAAAAIAAIGVPMNLASRSAPERLHAIPAAALAAIFFALARSVTPKQRS